MTKFRLLIALTCIGLFAGSVPAQRPHAGFGSRPAQSGHALEPAGWDRVLTCFGTHAREE